MKDTEIYEIFPVKGMSCASCAVSLESYLKELKGVSKAEVNYASQSAGICYDKKVLSASELSKAVQSLGYELLLDEEKNQVKEEQENLKAIKRKTLWAFVFSFPVFVIGMFFHHGFLFSNYIMFVLTAPVLFLFGRTFFVNAYKQASHGRANMDTLVALSTGIAFVFSTFNTFYPLFMINRGLEAHVYFEAAAVIIAFILLGKLLEENARVKTSSSIRKLMGLQPRTSIVIRNGQQIEISIAEIVPGDRVLVRPGDRVPVDGLVSEGSSYVDESMMTGEPVAVQKTAGAKVYAGSLNQKGSFVITTEKAGAETFLAHIIQRVKEAQGSKAPVQKLADKIAGIFVPVVLVLSLIVFTIWMFSGVENAFTHALLALVTVLIIACPCALGLATPTAIMAGIGKGAENNILIKDAESLELAHQVKTVVLDKTGTITKGTPEVTDIVWLDGLENIESLKSILHAAEIKSEHPLADAVVRYLDNDNSSAIDIESFESLTGLGISVVSNGKKYFVGSQKLMENMGFAFHPVFAANIEKYGAEAKTPVFFADEEKVLALLAIEDQVKESSREAVRSLIGQGIEVIMLTGDNESTARAVANKVGIQTFKAQAMPADKEDYIIALKKKGKVAMVGDGINDSQALARADVSIAMGKGSDIAIDVAKITLLSSDLLLLPKALNLSKQTVKTIKQNLFWAFIYNIVAIPVAAGVLYPVFGYLINPMVAGAAMALSSVSVVSNSLMLKYKRLL